MDWLDEKYDKIKARISNLSLRKSIIFYIVFFIIIVLVMIFVTYVLCNQWDSIIWSKYNQPSILNHPSANVFYYENYASLSEADRLQVEIIDIIQTWSVFLYSILGIVGVAYLFYRNKLKKPLQILATAADKIGENDLNIEIQYSVKDEMGELCNSFEIMRKQLIANNQKMWDVMEEQRRLNAAFAHDLRTPLTVLRGYTDFLKEYIPQGKISEEKLSSSLSLLSDNLTRLERYCNTMKEINSLDEIPLHKTLTDTVAFYQKLEDIITVMDGSNGIHIKLNSISLPKEELSVDEAIVMEVLENLMSNALRFAKTTVTVSLTIEEEAKLLLVSVKDDGKGFSTKDLNMATKAYYKDETEKNSCHFGIGLYICTILCEKHGGCISLSNSMNRGAVVTASFSIGTDI